MKMPSPSSSSLTSMKIKHLIRTLVMSCAIRVSRSLSRTRSFIAETTREKLYRAQIQFTFPSNWNYKKNKKAVPFGTSFRFHYNWCSSSRICYDAALDSMVPMEQLDWKRDLSNLSGYLQGLEEKDHNGSDYSTELVYSNEIDKLADNFIAKCHEKFVLEKQESYRRRLQENAFSVCERGL